MQELVCLHVAEDDDVAVVNALAIVAVLVTWLYDETDKFGALGVKFDHVAGLVHLGTVFCALEEGLAVIVQYLYFVTVLDNFPLTPVEDFFVCLDLLNKLLLELCHANFVLLRNPLTIFSLGQLFVVV